MLLRSYRGHADRGFNFQNTDLFVLRLDESGNAGKPLRVMAPEQKLLIRDNVFRSR